MVEILGKYVQDDGEGETSNWYEAIDEDGQLVITDGVQSIPVVGVLTSKTTPADFERFARLAAIYYSRRKRCRKHR